MVAVCEPLVLSSVGRAGQLVCCIARLLNAQTASWARSHSRPLHINAHPTESLWL